MRSEAFHNTADESGEALEVCEYKAAIQEKKVLDCFLSNPNRTFTSDEMHVAMYDFTHKTSTRRCISNLKNKGYVIDTGERRKGDAGKNQKIWKLSQTSTLDNQIKIAEHEDKLFKKNVKRFLKRFKTKFNQEDYNSLSKYL